MYISYFGKAMGILEIVILLLLVTVTQNVAGRDVPFVNKFGPSGHVQRFMIH